jgi:type II secretory ATPase GspE/PulE/Tfp pilus assembly ATPase PilB-like protein
MTPHADHQGPLALDVKPLAPEAAVSALIDHAASAGASDLFLCADEREVGVMVSHLGLLRPVCRLAADHGRRCMAHVKAMAGMDIAEKRRPLDGRWLLTRPGKGTLDLRVSTIPTLHGEDFTLRLLDRSSRLLDLDQLGMLRRDLNQLAAMLSGPSGLIVVTGPTGSGKTTTLYGCLRSLHNGIRKINTIEDPVEYALNGVRQSQANPRIGVGFPELLRAALRQAPDVIMVGEVRDAETAATAVRAANSGHLVLATMHAPVAAGAVDTLLNLGVPPPFLAGSLVGVVSQRLVRTLCAECKAGFDISETPHSFVEVKRFLGPGTGERLFGPRGCSACRMMGYAGRSGVFEVMSLTPGLRKLILEKAPAQALHRKAVEEGMIPFRLAALLKVALGDTSIEEVFRVIPMEYLGEG